MLRDTRLRFHRFPFTGTFASSLTRHNLRPQHAKRVASLHRARIRISGRTSRPLHFRPRHTGPPDQLPGWPLQAPIEECRGQSRPALSLCYIHVPQHSDVPPLRHRMSLECRNSLEPSTYKTAVDPFLLKPFHHFLSAACRFLLVIGRECLRRGSQGLQKDRLILRSVPRTKLVNFSSSQRRWPPSRERVTGPSAPRARFSTRFSKGLTSYQFVAFRHRAPRHL
jgi:hypothetical protein